MNDKIINNQKIIVLSIMFLIKEKKLEFSSDPNPYQNDTDQQH